MSKVRELTPELAKQAEAELNEVSSRTAEDLKVLREWINKQPHLFARQGKEVCQWINNIDNFISLILPSFQQTINS